MIDPKDIAKMTMFSGWPAAATAAAPTHGTQAGNAQLKPSTNVEVMADAMGMAALAAVAAMDPPTPIKICRIGIAGIGTDQVVGRYVE